MSTWIFQCLRFTLIVALLATGVAAAPRQASAEEPALEGAPLRIANRFIITLRGPVAGYSAQDRVANTLQRIENVLESEPLPEVSTEADGVLTRVLVGGKRAFVVTPADIDQQIGETTSAVAEEAAKRLTLALAEHREQATPRYLAIAASYAFAATLLYGLIVWLLAWINGSVERRATVAAERRAIKLQVGGIRLVESSRLRRLTRNFILLCAWLVGITATVTWLAYVLERFPYTRPWGEQLQFNLLSIVRQIALSLSAAMPGLVFVALIVFLARNIIRVAALLFDRIEQGKVQLGWVDPYTVGPTRRLFALVVCVFALAIAYPHLPGADTEAFKGLSVLVGVMVSLGGSSVVGQAANGLTLMYSRACRKGDYVRIGQTEGKVLEIGLFATRLKTSLGEEIMLPSSNVMETTIKNYSRAAPGTGFVVDTAVTIGYATPWRQVRALLEEAARRTPNLATTPAPMVRQTALGDFYVKYKLAVYTSAEQPAPRTLVLNDLHTHILDVFNEYGVQIMSPHYEGDPGQPQLVGKQAWYTAPARPPEGEEPAGRQHVGG